VEAEHRARPRFIPNDPAWTEAEPEAPAATLQWWAERSNFPVAWDYSRGAGARIAIVDTGIDETHPDLARRVILRRSFDLPQTPPEVDVLGHGTHVASLACGAGDNRVGIAGAAMECRILNAKTGEFYDSGVAKAIVWATDEGADVINLSFGSKTRPASAVRAAIRRAARRDIVLVAAAADEAGERQGYPANLLQPAGTAADLDEGVGLSVTAATFQGNRADFAGSGPEISMAAYGVFDEDEGPLGILGAFPAAVTQFELGDPDMQRLPCRCRTSLAGDLRYGYLQGTSMATAMVSGAAALVRSLNPDLSARQVVRLLKQTAQRPTGSRWNPDLGWGILDAGAAVAAAQTRDERAPSSRIKDLPPTRPAGTRLQVGYSFKDRAPRDVQQARVRNIEILMRVDGGRWRRLATVAPGRRPPAVTLEGGRRYDFATVAIDRAGNRERRPRRPDQSVLAV
jgi:subtilisin family serine protease